MLLLVDLVLHHGLGRVVLEGLHALGLRVLYRLIKSLERLVQQLRLEVKDLVLVLGYGLLVVLLLR